MTEPTSQPQPPTTRAQPGPGAAGPPQSESSNDVTVFLGVDWTDPRLPALRFAPRLRSARSRLEPFEWPRSYSVLAGQLRLCTGYFDLSITPPAHVTCDAWRPVTSGTQCPTCRHREGFTRAHTAHRGAQAVPEHVRRYLSQPHYLYVDAFPDGTCKVGTVAEARLGSRLAEQGAAAAYYVARAADGTQIRHAEADVAAHFGLKQAVTTRRKITALQNSRPDLEQLRASVTDLADAIQAYLRQAGVPGWEVLPDPQPWTPPPAAMTVFTSAPLPAYPGEINTGQHNLVIAGIAGSIAALAPAPEQSATYLADLTPLRGVPLHLDDYAAALTVANPTTQEALF
jgi:hypothetical protein